MEVQIRNDGNDKEWIFETLRGNDNLKFFQELKNFLKQLKIVEGLAKTFCVIISSFKF